MYWMWQYKFDKDENCYEIQILYFNIYQYIFAHKKDVPRVFEFYLGLPELSNLIESWFMHTFIEAKI